MGFSDTHPLVLWDGVYGFDKAVTVQVAGGSFINLSVTVTGDALCPIPSCFSLSSFLSLVSSLLTEQDLSTASLTQQSALDATSLPLVGGLFVMSQAQVQLSACLPVTRLPTPTEGVTVGH